MLIQRSLAVLTIPVVTFLLSNISGCSNFASVQAKSANFACTQIDGVQTTVAKTQGGDIPVIKWVSKDLDAAGWPPEKRCAEVSGRFQAYYQDGTLKYITTGQINGENVICTADREGGDCKNLLFTIRPGHSPQATFQNLLAVRHGDGGALTETGSRPYLNIDRLLGTDPSGRSPAKEKSPKPLW